MESHPAHASLPPSARSDAPDALTWSYTGRFSFTSSPRYKSTQIFPDCLLPPVRPAPPPFSQDECQEPIKLLETLGKVIPLDVLPRTKVTRIFPSPRMWFTHVLCRVSLCAWVNFRVHILRKVCGYKYLPAQWRQHYFRPDRPLLKDASNRQPRRAGRAFSSRLRDLFMSTVCLGLPYLYMKRANPLRITDEESITRSAGSMLAVGEIPPDAIQMKLRPQFLTRNLSLCFYVGERGRFSTQPYRELRCSECLSTFWLCGGFLCDAEEDGRLFVIRSEGVVCETALHPTEHKLMHVLPLNAVHDALVRWGQG